MWSQASKKIQDSRLYRSLCYSSRVMFSRSDVQVLCESLTFVPTDFLDYCMAGSKEPDAPNGGALKIITVSRVVGLIDYLFPGMT